MSKCDVEVLGAVDVPEGAHVLSAYLQTHSAESETVFRQQLRQIERTFEAESSLNEFEQCAARITEFLGKFEARAPMLVIFCTASGPMWVRQIDVLLPNVVKWGETPYWKPLVEAVDEFEPFAVLLLNNSSARLISAYIGKVHEHRVLLRKPDESVETYMKNVATAVAELMDTECPARLILAGERKMWSEFIRQAPEYISKSIIGMIKVRMNASLEEVLESSREMERLAERRFELRQVDELLRLAAKHKRVATSLRTTLDALKDGSIWRLVYAENFSARGVQCPICDSLWADESEVCPKCNSSVRPVDDLLPAIISRTLASNASIEQVRGKAAERLMAVGGIGAFLRF